ncbi:unnamed protein product [Camellia sinensis]
MVSMKIQIQKRPQHRHNIHHQGWRDRKPPKNSGGSLQDSDKIQKKKEVANVVPLYKLFSFADFTDYVLTLVGTMAAIGNGICMPLMSVLLGELIDSFGQTVNTKQVVHQFSKEVACWMVTGERQSARIRSLYLRTLLGQEIGYCDKETTTGEIISRMSGDTFLIQDAMGERVGKFIQLVASFFGGFVIALIKGWLLTLVLLSSVPPIIISTGIMIIITAKMTSRGQIAYSLAGTVVKQTIGSIRTVASFTGERQAINKYKKSLLKAYRSGVQAVWVMINRTTIIVAHHLGTVKNADMIAVIHRGKIVEKGSHSELIQDPEGAFCQLLRLQELSKDSEQKNADDQDGPEIIVDSGRHSSQRVSLRSLSQGSSGIGNSSRHSFSILFGVPTAINFLEKTTAEPTTPASATLQAVVPQVPLRRLAYLNKPEIPMLIIGSAAAVIHGLIMPIFGFGAISARLSGDATLVRNLVGDSLALIVQNAATAIVGLVIAFQANRLLALIILVMVPLIGLNGYIQAKFLSGFSADAKER